MKLRRITGGKVHINVTCICHVGVSSSHAGMYLSFPFAGLLSGDGLVSYGDEVQIE